MPPPRATTREIGAQPPLPRPRTAPEPPPCWGTMGHTIPLLFVIGWERGGRTEDASATLPAARRRSFHIQTHSPARALPPSHNDPRGATRASAHLVIFDVRARAVSGGFCAVAFEHRSSRLSEPGCVHASAHSRPVPTRTRHRVSRIGATRARENGVSEKRARVCDDDDGVRRRAQRHR